MTGFWNLPTTPFAVQLEARSRSRGKTDFGWWCDMGTGKTQIDLDETVELLMNDHIQGEVVVCPNSLKGNWIAEVKKCEIPITTYMWPQVPPIAKLIKPFLIAINYEAVGTGRAEEYIEKLAKSFPIKLTLDEAIKIKNPKSKVGQACQRLGKISAYRRLLSGAPMTQGPHDMWAQLHMLNAIGTWGYTPFKHHFCQMGGFMGKQVVGVKPENAQALTDLINKCGFRALKKDWTDLPEKLYTTRMVPLNKEQQGVYLELEEELFTIIQDEEVSADMVITKMLKLQQVSSGFLITDDKNTHRLTERSPKVDEIFEIMEQLDGKLIVQAVYRESIKILIEAFEKHNPAWIRGQMKPEEIEAQKAKFNTDDSCRIIVCQESAAKYGHTLLGSEKVPCHTMVFFENSFSLDDRVQSEDRNHRHGQKHDVLYIDLCTSPIEQRAIDALQRKFNIASHIMDGVKVENLRSR